MGDALSQRPPLRRKTLSSSRLRLEICALSAESRENWRGSPLLAKSTLPAGSVTLARDTLGASPVVLTETPTQAAWSFNRASLACSDRDVAWWASLSLIHISEPTRPY